ncbi:MAG: MASE1 domain-containing protein, partial [Ktedonobacterales bacterium]
MSDPIVRLKAAKTNAVRYLDRLRRQTQASLDVVRARQVTARRRIGRLRTVLSLPDFVVRVGHKRLFALSWPPRRTALAVLLLCVAFYLAALIGLTLHFPASLVYFVWPPSVVLFVALVLTPARIWWIYALAVLPVHMLAELGTVSAPPSSLLLFYGIVWVQAIVGALCVIRFAHLPFQLSNLRALIVFLLSGAGAAALVEAFTLSTVLALTSPDGDFGLDFAQTFLADALTMLVLAPTLFIGWTTASRFWLASGAQASEWGWLTHARNGVREWLRTLSVSRMAETSLLALGLLAVGLVAFGGYITFPATLPALLYAVLPLLLWASVRFGLGGTGFALCGLTLMSILYAIHMRGPFTTSSTTENLFSLQLFFIAISV